MERYLNLWAESLPQLLTSTVAVTIPLSLISFALALLVGIISAGARTSRFAPVNWLAWLYIWVFRGTPLLVQLFIVFYGLPKVAVKKDSSLQNVSEISGHSSAQSETSNFRKMVEAKGASIVVVSGFDEAIEQVLSGRAEMTANDSVSFAEYFKEHPDANLRLLSGDLGTGSNSSILLPKGQDALRNAIDESLKKHLENGDIKAIYEKYVGEDLSPKN